VDYLTPSISSVSNSFALARAEFGLAGALMDLTDVESAHPAEDMSEALKQITASLQDCPSTTPPDGSRRDVVGIVQKVKHKFGFDHCPLDAGTWANVKAREVALFSLMSGSALDDGTARDRAEDSYRGAMQVLHRSRFPVSWADAQLNLGLALIKSPPRSTAEGCASLRRANSLAKDAQSVLTFPAMATAWKVSKSIEAGTSLDLVDCATSEEERLGWRAAGAKSIEEIRSHFGEDLPSMTAPYVGRPF
jgi:hypothetical protein